MYSTGYYHNRVVVTHAIGHMMCVMCTEPLHCMEEPFGKVTWANIYKYIYIYIYVCVYIYICMCIYIYIFVYLFAIIYLHIFTYAHVFLHHSVDILRCVHHEIC